MSSVLRDVSDALSLGLAVAGFFYAAYYVAVGMGWEAFYMFAVSWVSFQMVGPGDE